MKDKYRVKSTTTCTRLLKTHSLITILLLWFSTNAQNQWVTLFNDMLICIYNTNMKPVQS